MIQEEQFELNWFRWLLLIVALATFSTGAFIAINSYFGSKHREQDSKVYDALLARSEGKEADVAPFFSTRPCAGLARISEAGKLANKGEIEQAMALLEGGRFKGTDLVCSVSRLMWMGLASELPLEKVDEAKFYKHLDSFKAGSPFYARSQLLAAVLSIRRGKLNEASTFLEKAMPGAKDEANALWCELNDRRL